MRSNDSRQKQVATTLMGTLNLRMLQISKPDLSNKQNKPKGTNKSLEGSVTAYRLFFLRSIAQFFTQIYTNCFVSS